MMIDSYLYLIVALLPLVALILIVQTNPYRALVIRGILGAIAALVYSILGAADVALTEALVGTLLAITLYAVAARSSLVFRLGVLNHELKDEANAKDDVGSSVIPSFKHLVNDLRTIFGKRYMQVELVPYPNQSHLDQALVDQDVHAICMPRYHPQRTIPVKPADGTESPLYQTTTRLRHLHDIMQTELTSSLTDLTCIDLSKAEETHS
jgi:putative multicomponent Na+:H+ antiporter subunit B